jgi:hypothetical protein
MVLLASKFDQSKYLRAEDLKQERTVRIKNVTVEMVNDRGGQVQKLVIWFTNTKKGLVLNKTNNRVIRSAYGDDTAGWAEKLIVIFPTQADLAGRVVPALRVRIPQQTSGNGQTVSTPLDRSAEASPTRPIASNPEPERDDFDDEIPL